ncbi:MAG: carboxypeptidase regulatory-like domain-containing protein, partial [Bacteroidales bacterium]|nr:carboxypeptidase regulatory-like domain-containing protein [Bacteroidales bacterium]
MVLTGLNISKSVLFILILFLTAGQLPAQKSNKKIIITGTVLNAAGKPIPNAIVMIDGVKTNSMTDAEGKYSVRVKPDASKIGIFTFGDGIKEEDIAGRVLIDFNFSSMSFQQPATGEIPEGDKSVNTGYGYTRKKDLTTQMDVINGKNRKYASYSSIYEMIQRECSGVRIDGGKII